MKTKEAIDALDACLIRVARSAQDMSDNAVPNIPRGGWKVRQEDMADLREALAEWTKATQEVLGALKEGVK